MLGAAIICFLINGKSLGMVASTAYSSIDVFAFLAIPGFILAGNLMLHGKIADTILLELNNITKGTKSVLGSFAVILSMLFGTILGSAAATVALVGGMLIPKMNELGYSRDESAALIAASGILGLLIPPSIPGIMYAIAAGESIMDVWISTIPIALLVGLLWIIVNIVKCAKMKKPVSLPTSKTEQATTSKRFSVHSIPAILAPVVIFAGIFGGIFTPTEASAVIVVYSLIVGLFVYKGLNRNNLYDIILKSAKSSAAIVILIAFASVAGRFFTLINLPKMLVDFMGTLNLTPIGFLIVVNVLLIIVGMFMETNTAILILTPLLLPIAKSFGINPIHFGAIMLFNLQLGMLTPPFAGNIFVVCKVADVSFDKVIRPIIPYILVALPVLVITTYFPNFSLFFVNLFR